MYVIYIQTAWYKYQKGSALKGTAIKHNITKEPLNNNNNKNHNKTFKQMHLYWNILSFGARPNERLPIFERTLFNKKTLKFTMAFKNDQLPKIAFKGEHKMTLLLVTRKKWKRWNEVYFE